MSYKKILIILLLLSIILLVSGYIIVFPENYGVCVKGDYACIYPNANVIGEPLFFGLIPLIPILIILQFFRREVVVAWAKFAVVLMPVIILMIYNTPVQCSAPLGLCFDKKSITRFLSEGFAILSLIIIFTKAFLLGRREKKRMINK